MWHISRVAECWLFFLSVAFSVGLFLQARKWQAKRMVKRKLLDREDAIQKQKELEEEALEQEHAALILQKRMRGLHAKKEVAAKRAVVAAEQAALEEERQDLEDQAKGATALQSMFRARKAKQAVRFCGS